MTGENPTTNFQRAGLDSLNYRRWFTGMTSAIPDFSDKWDLRMTFLLLDEKLSGSELLFLDDDKFGTGICARPLTSPPVSYQAQR